MRHNVDGRKFGRNTSHRAAMFRNMANSLILEEQVVTTAEKAKEVRRVVDGLITMAKRGTPHSSRLLFDRTRDDAVVSKMVVELAERYKNRAGGYTRVLRLAERRWGDAAEMAVLELVDRVETQKGRTGTTQGQSESSAGASSTAPLDGNAQKGEPADPFRRFRRLFQGSKNKS